MRIFMRVIQGGSWMTMAFMTTASTPSGMLM